MVEKRFSQKIELAISAKTASELYGLSFGNRMDDLLATGLKPKTLTYLYGTGVGRTMNSLCGRAINSFGGRSVFIDASNSFDPYLMVNECNIRKNSSDAAEKLLRSIMLSRVFTCYQLEGLVVEKLGDVIKSEERNQVAIKSVFVSGIDAVFDEQDNTKEETDRLQFLIASALRKIASDKASRVLFVVASSANVCKPVLEKCDIGIKMTRSKNGKKEATLMKHYSKRFASMEM